MNDQELNRILGFRVMSTPLLTDTKIVERSFWERWFTRPWTPMEKFKQVYEGPGDYIIDKQNGVLYASPEAIEILKKELS